MDDLLELLDAGALFDVERDRDGFVVSYDDVPAHEHADLVAASGDALAALPGVTSVVHEDREVLLVAADGSLDASRLETALQAFWRAAATGPAPWKEALEAAAWGAAPTLRAAGFRKQGLHWNRDTATGLVQVVELSRTETADGYAASIDIGIFDEEASKLRDGRGRPRFVREYEAQVRHHVAVLPIDPDPAALLAVLHDDVLPLLDRVRSRADVLAEEWPRLAMFNPIDRAILLSLEGAADEAHRLLQRQFEWLRGARAHIREVTARCGLAPLETGTDPDRSVAEEALLPAWIAGREEARTRFLRTFAAGGGDPRRLDGSVRSLDEIHPRWRDLVAAAQRDPADHPPSPLMALPTSTWSRFRHAPPADPRPTAAAQHLTEGLASYFAHVLQRSVPAAHWTVVETSSGFEPAIGGLSATPGGGVADVVRSALRFLAAALGPLTPEQERLFRRYNPMRADLERWLDGAPRTAESSTRRSWFRRG